MSNAGSPLRTTGGSNFLYQEPCSPRTSLEIFLRNSHPHDMGLTFPPQSDSCSAVHVKLETSTINESVLEAVVARAYICLRNKGILCITLPKYQGTSTTTAESQSFVPIQIDENDEEYVISCSKV
ncbi:hypothetical protein Gasu2_56270 [Galdieria sulphuraria]|nr:hypothetical protein Gasu2_56270 [Galdieria sulphuraria]